MGRISLLLNCIKKIFNSIFSMYILCLCKWVPYNGHTRCMRQEAYMEYKLLKIFKQVVGRGFKSW
jgi:hypothetical protein